ncbi:hypothetical protein [Terribacillus sp. JSM ZJ617]|uniref:hypothetical protein n=1 Tax=Terribacillus sp. JSM ZJ617 TaxID=3342119 RepID=UPI0035A89B5B
MLKRNSVNQADRCMTKNQSEAKKMEERLNSKQTIICQDCDDVIDVTVSPEGGRTLYGVCPECSDDSNTAQ